MVNILQFKDIGKGDIPVVGGKAANIGEMFNAKFPMPPGFVVTADAYKEFIELSGIQKKINSILKETDVDNAEQLANSSEKIQNLILSTDMPIDIAKDIKKTYEHMNISPEVLLSKQTLDFVKAGRDLAFVAVRSSATAEDLPSISKDEHILVKIDDRMFFRRMEEIYELVGDGSNFNIEIPALKDNKIQWIKVGELYKHKIKNDEKLYKITTETGREITVSPNHTLIVLDENKLEPKNVKSVQDLKGNEKLPAINYLPILDFKQEYVDVLDYIVGKDIVEIDNLIKIKNNSTNWSIQSELPRKLKITKDFAYFLGLYCAEGSIYGNNEIILTNKDNDIMNRIIKFASTLNLYNNQKLNKGSLRLYNKTLLRFLDSVCGNPDPKIKGKGKICRNKKVPEFVFGWNKELIGEFLKGCFDGDGECGKKNLGYCSTSKLLISGIIKLLEMLNIGWYLREKKSNESFNINIQSLFYEKFGSLIGFESTRKGENLKILIEKVKYSNQKQQFLNSLSISSELSKLLRNKFEKQFPLKEITINYCPKCKNKLIPNSLYKNKKRFHCKSCCKSFYEDQIISKKELNYINYDSKGRFVKKGIPWNKGYNTKKLSFNKLKKDLGKNNICFDSLHDSVKWDKIKKIQEIDYNDYVYDFSIPEVENFAAGVGGIITHNSASFAGQQSTYLNVRGIDNVTQAVHQCWASLYTGRAIYYREKNGFEHSKVYIAVVVQKMINSEKAGVMFSINPSTNDESEIIIEAGYGLGEAVVSGSITPDEYIVNKSDLSLKSKKINSQAWMIIRDPNTGRNMKKELGERGKEQILKEEEIKAIALLGKKIEEYYKKPQDMEFAVAGNRVYIVQSRPITTQKKVEEASQESVSGGVVLLEGIAASPGVKSGFVKIIKGPSELNKIEKGDILVASMTDPDYVPAMQRAGAIVTDEGGSTSHAAIVSREMGIPCIVGTREATSKLKDGMEITVDGTKGKVYEGKIEMIKSTEKIEIMEDIETITKIKLIMDLPNMAEKASTFDVDGVGLLRLEIMIGGGGKWPDKYISEGRKEDYVRLLYDGIGKIAKAFEGKPIWIRNSDMRTDEYTTLKGSEDQPKEGDPMLGWHAIRRLLDQPEVLKAEFEAIKRLHNDGIKNIGVMLPFVINVDEIVQAKKLMREVGLEPREDVKFGVMIETPAICWIIEDVCKEGVDFVSFGTNDLTQLTLGIDRDNSKIQKSFNEMHPAVLGEMKKVIITCKKYGVETSVCGQAGSKPEMAKFLVKTGIDSISVNLDAVNTIKKTVSIEEKKMLLEAIRNEGNS